MLRSFARCPRGASQPREGNGGPPSFPEFLEPTKVYGVSAWSYADGATRHPIANAESGIDDAQDRCSPYGVYLIAEPRTIN